MSCRERAGELHSIPANPIPADRRFTTGADGKIEFVNEHWLQYSGSKREFPPTHPDDPEPCPAMGENGGFGTKRSRWKCGYGRLIGEEEYRYHLLRAIPIREGDTITKWVGTFTDIEDQKQAVKKKDEFISIASQELKTPLTTIKAYTQLLDLAIEEAG